ncbi:Fc.00g054020.m01.CDS01 [Cosmosporella sp. VM-42]
MYSSLLVSALSFSVHLIAIVTASPPPPRQPIAPKVMILSMWTPEAEVWYKRLPSSGLGNLTAISISSPGFSMLYPRAFCTEDASICQLTLGEGEINSAATLMALVLSPKFDLRQTYIVTAGIAGVNPRYGTLGSVAIVRYAVQVALQYEIDSRSIPSDWPTGYIAYGRAYPHEYPCITYGTEVFELNAQLQEVAYALASKAKLMDDGMSQRYRRHYGDMGNVYQIATRPPSVIKCDSATSDVYYSGRRLSEAFENTTTVWTNGTGKYCMSAQEENATLEILVRGAIDNLLDFGRVIVIRTGSNFDRPPPGQSDWAHLTRQQNGFAIAIQNIFNAGVEIIKGIIEDWDCSFKNGVATSNYVGDIFGSLGGDPDFGYGSITEGKRVTPYGMSQGLARREIKRRSELGTRPFGKI